MMKRYGCWTVFAGLAAGVLQADNLVQNSGFESIKDGVAEGWSSVAPVYAYQEGAGRNGTAGLFFNNTDPAFYSFPGQRIALKPGKAYRYSIWVRTEELKGDESGATICIEWSSKEGKWIGGAYVDGVKGTTKDWVKIEGVTPTIPPEAATIRVHPYVRRGMVGKAWFDDVEVTPYYREPVYGLFASAYRNCASGGTVTFHASLAVDTDQYPMKDLAGTLSVTGADGKPLSIPADAARLTETEAAVTVDVAKLAMGSQTVTFRLATRDGQPVGKPVETTFTRTEKPVSRRVWIDDHQRTIVDGKPFFPLGMYWSGVSKERLDIFKQAPFNCLMPYQAPDKQGLDLCQAAGLKVIYSVKDIYSGTKWAPAPVKTEADELAWIRERVNLYANHPALLAWYINDELSLSLLKRLTARQQLMERLDGDHPTWVVLYQYDQIREYMPTFDVIGTDPYPIPSKPAGMATTWTRVTRKGSFGCRAMWQVPQAFDWGAYHSSEPSRQTRAPTLEEMRSMAWQCVAAGANGLIFYSFFDFFKAPNNVPFEVRWKDMKQVAEEFAARIPMLLSVEPAPTVTGAPETLGVRCWRWNGAVYLLAVNSTNEPLEATLTLGETANTAALELGTTPPTLTGNRVKISLAPIEPMLIKLN
ncbi:MAG: hypothetical protein J6334_06450 [Kiritimatiellae bacterium]|nr:hypothetical protein [Kiritimatiellia bacterium]